MLPGASDLPEWNLEVRCPEMGSSAKVVKRGRFSLHGAMAKIGLLIAVKGLESV